MNAGVAAVIRFIDFIARLTLGCEVLFFTAARKLHTH